MTTKTNLKAGGWSNNHNETLVRDAQAANLKTKTGLRAGKYKIIFDVPHRVQG